jgi:hypothetical protein
MADVTSGRQGDALRPEDATTLEEFHARRDAELARIGAVSAYWKQGARIALAVAVAAIDAFYWYRFSQASGTERWHVLALALLFLCATVSVTSRIRPDVLSGSKRRRAELERLAAQWQERADRGEVALTTLTTLTPVVNLRTMGERTAPGGPAVSPDTPEAG